MKGEGYKALVTSVTPRTFYTHHERCFSSLHKVITNVYGHYFIFSTCVSIASGCRAGLRFTSRQPSMSILPQHKYPSRFLSHVRTSPVTCSATTTKPRPSSDQVTVKPRLVSPPPMVKTDAAPALAPRSLNDPSLRSTWPHRLWVATGCSTVMISLAKSVMGAAHSHIWLEPVLAGYLGYILADLGSGVYHWGIDNYGDASTLFFGSQIEAFQGHHKWPWTITRRQFANNLNALARAITFTVLPLDVAFDDPTVHGFVSVCAFCIMFSQQFHAWAHGTKSKLSPAVVALQEVGVLVSRQQHTVHHRQPYNNNYCIVSGIWNEVLDQNKVFEALEMVLYFRTGVRPRSWDEPSSDWTEEMEVSSQVIDH